MPNRLTVFVASLLVACAVAPVSARQFIAKPRTFKCLTDGERAPGLSFYVSGKNKKTIEKAMAVTTAGATTDAYPVGTILQLFPFEAMVKRGGKFNPSGGGWEYFRLTFDDKGRTQIAARGGVEVANVIGSCQGCHTQVAPSHDSVCEFVIGASGLGLTDAQIAAAQASDPRCKK